MSVRLHYACILISIGLQVYDVNNNNISHALNNRHLKISKNYGLIKTFLFRKFPDYNPGYPYLIEYDITGISSPELGIRNLTWKEVFDDFYPGDELHVLTESCYGDLSDLSCSVRRSIFKYLTRIEYPDSLKYTLERISSLKTTQSGSSTGLLSKESYVAEDLSREINKRIESQKRTIRFMKIMAIITFIYFILQGLI